MANIYAFLELEEIEGGPRTPNDRHPGSTSINPCSSNQARMAALMRERAARNGRRSAWASGVHQGLSEVMMLL